MNTANQEPDPVVNETRKRRSKRGLWILLAALVLIVAAAVAAFFSLRNKEEQLVTDGRVAIELGGWGTAVTAFDDALAIKPDFIRLHDTESLSLRGFAHYQQGALDAALADFDAALEADPDLVDLYAYRADIHFQEGRFDEALDQAESAFNHETLLPEYLLALLHSQRAQIYLDQGDSDAFMDESAAALELDQFLPDEVVAEFYSKRALAVYDLGDDEQSRANIMTALEFEQALSPSDRAQHLANLSHIYYDQGLFDMMMETSESALALEALPDESAADLHMKRSGVLFDRDDLSGAIDEAEEAVAYGHQEDRLLTLQALQFYRDNEAADALSAAEEALEFDGDNALALRIRGSVFTWQGKLDKALADLDRSLELDATNVQALAMRVFLHLEMNDLVAAEADLARAKEINQASPAVLWAQALVEEYNHRDAYARSLLDLAIELDDSRPEFYAWRAATYRLVEDAEKRAADLERALTLYENFPHALVGSLENRINQDDYSSYEHDVFQLGELYPDWYVSYEYLAHYYRYEVGDLETALENADQAIALRPDSTAGYLARGRVHMAAEEYELARADFEEALKLQPKSVYARGWLHEWHVAQGEYEEAIAYLDEILDTLPDSALALAQKVRIYAIQGETEEAWSMVHEALGRDPNHPYALWLRASLEEDLGMYDEALADVNRMLELFPNDADAYHIQARVYRAQGEADKAVQSASRALELNPYLTDAYWTLTWATANSNTDEALQITERWIEAAPESTDAYFTQGALHNYEGHSQEAVDSLTNSLDLVDSDDPWASGVYYERALAYLDLGEPESARADLESALSAADDLEIIDDAEILLADPSVMAVVVDGRRIIEDPDNGFTVSFAEFWQQAPAELGEGHVLSLEAGDAFLDATVELFVFEWDPALSVYDLASAINPEDDDTSVMPLESIELAGGDGLVREFEALYGDIEVKGAFYYAAVGSRAVVIRVDALAELYADFEAEFEAIALSFNFLP